MKTMKELKNYLKDTAVKIRSEKAKRKTVPNGYVDGLDELRHVYRDYHIAYSILRGTPIEKIEHNTDYIKSTLYLIEFIMLPFKRELAKQELENGK